MGDHGKMEKYTSFKNVNVKQESTPTPPPPTEASAGPTRNSTKNAPFISTEEAFNSGSKEDMAEDMENPFLKSNKTPASAKKTSKWWSCM